MLVNDAVALREVVCICTAKLACAKEPRVRKKHPSVRLGQEVIQRWKMKWVSIWGKNRKGLFDVEPPLDLPTGRDTPRLHAK